jgi:hypothetical protein
MFYRYNDFTMAEMQKLLDMLGGEEIARRLLAGDHKINIEIVRHVINLKRPPSYHDEHEHPQIHESFAELWTWNAREVELVPPNELKTTSDSTLGHAWRTDLSLYTNLNARVSDYLLRHQELIPKGWRQHILCFWGTVFSEGGVGLKPDYSVSTLTYQETRWVQKKASLGSMFDSRHVAMTLKDSVL